MNMGRNYDALELICKTGCIVSPICLIIHLFKFFNAPTKQNLPSKNLASYCICSLLLYACMMSYSCFTGVLGPRKLLTVKEYLYICSSLLLLNMSLDTYICMKKSVKNFRLSKGSRVSVFIIYTIFAWGVSLSVTVGLYFAIDSDEKRFNVTLAITMLMRMICLALFCLSMYYIKSADITNITNLKAYVFMHARLMMINGITSVLWYVTLAMIFYFDTWNGLLKVSLFLSIVLYAYDGVFIAFFYTFKKGMFDGKHVKNLNACHYNQICKTSDMISPSSQNVEPMAKDLCNHRLDMEV